MAGLALAGGRSVRFGAEKAAAILLGRPLLTWALDHLALTCGPLAVSARPGSIAEQLGLARGCAILPDAEDDAAGPLAGIRAGLAWAKGRGVEVLAIEPCDAPLLPEDLHSRLAAALGDAPAAAARTSDGLQPLCALWRVDALDAVAAALEGGRHPPIWRFLAELGAAQASFDDPGAFANTNRPEDLQAAAERLAGRPLP